MFYTIYQIKNKIDGKIYLGKHQTNQLNDDYYGSGKLLLRALKKHGRHNFEKSILYVFADEQAMNAKEKELVTPSFCLDKNNYNLCVGGHGGWGYINSSGRAVPYFTKDNARVCGAQGVIRKQQLRDSDPVWAATYKMRSSEALKGKISPFFGKRHTKATKQKISLARKGKYAGELNPCFGKPRPLNVRNKISDSVKRYYENRKITAA